MPSEPFQKETPDPAPSQGRGKGTQGAERKQVSIPIITQTSFQKKNLDIRFDLCRVPDQLFHSKPAGPLSQDMLSLGGSFFSGGRFLCEI